MIALVTVMWVDYSGQLKSFGFLAPRRLSLSTYEGQMSVMGLGSAGN